MFSSISLRIRTIEYGSYVKNIIISWLVNGNSQIKIIINDRWIWID